MFPLQDSIVISFVVRTNFWNMFRSYLENKTNPEFCILPLPMVLALTTTGKNRKGTYLRNTASTVKQTIAGASYLKPDSSKQICFGNLRRLATLQYPVKTLFRTNKSVELNLSEGRVKSDNAFTVCMYTSENFRCPTVIEGSIANYSTEYWTEGHWTITRCPNQQFTEASSVWKGHATCNQNKSTWALA